MFSTGGFLSWSVTIMVSALFFAGSISAAVKTELVAEDLSLPIYVCSPPGDSNRLFIVEQKSGEIKILDFTTGLVNPTPFIDVPNLATGGGEQGLLGLAFHPRYRSNGFFYVNITSSSGGRTEILRYTADGDPATSQTASTSSRKLLLSFTQPEANHNGGWIDFGPDGYLYIASGDGGDGNDQHGSIGNGQNRATLLGKILRIDVNSGENYGIPDGNPFKDHATYRKEIWAFGLRNPWRCSFDPQTGHLWIADVGQGRLEEIDVNPAGQGGLNFGWRPYEGNIRTPGIPSSEEPVTEHTLPVFVYGRSLGQSVTGGYVYRGNAVPELRDKYIFGDYASGRYWAMALDDSGTNGTAQPLVGLSAARNPSSFGVDARGELYICDHQQGEVYRIVSDTPPPSLSIASTDRQDFVLSFAAAANLEYTVETKSPLVGEAAWTPLTNFPSAANARTLSLTNQVTGAAQYFRLRAQ